MMLHLIPFTSDLDGLLDLRSCSWAAPVEPTNYPRLIRQEKSLGHHRIAVCDQHTSDLVVLQDLLTRHLNVSRLIRFSPVRSRDGEERTNLGRELSTINMGRWIGVEPLCC